MRKWHEASCASRKTINDTHGEGVKDFVTIAHKHFYLKVITSGSQNIKTL